MFIEPTYKKRINPDLRLKILYLKSSCFFIFVMAVLIHMHVARGWKDFSNNLDSTFHKLPSLPYLSPLKFWLHSLDISISINSLLI